ncbi:hypothetical protein BJ912DRAFT_1072122 [Pholiota molesta]|nr:hypothetical protein BJ912DRAFT_1072122 [Pholiota molesta]
MAPSNSIVQDADASNQRLDLDVLPSSTNSDRELRQGWWWWEEVEVAEVVEVVMEVVVAEEEEAVVEEEEAVAEEEEAVVEVEIMMNVIAEELQHLHLSPKSSSSSLGQHGVQANQDNVDSASRSRRAHHPPPTYSGASTTAIAEEHPTNSSEQFMLAVGLSS